MKKLILLSFAIFSFILFISNNYFFKNEYAIEENYVFSNYISLNKNIIKDNIDTSGTEIVNKNTEDFIKTEELINIGTLEIPKINLKGEIKEGTSNNVIDRYIGHFECTNIWNGNVAICAHNNGYSRNYFAKINELEIGDSIIYSSNYGTRKYIVSNLIEIEETDIYVLDKSEENKLTLITCISGKPTKRLCVQAIEKREDIE